MSKAAQLAALIGSGQAQGDKNLIINGAMQVAQRGTSTSSATSAAYHAVDRFDQNIVTMGAYTISQSTTAPTDFTTSLKMDVTTADASPASGDVVAIRTKLEGLNLQQLNFGTSNAKSITISFYVKSNKTGTYVVSSYLADAGKQWGQTYTIDSANTWERKTITWQGSSNSSVINNDSGAGLIFTWYLGAGTGRTSGTAQTDWTAYATTGEAVGQTVNIADSTANEFLITGVQLEVGDVATPFEHESFAATLQKCQRYYTETKSFTVEPGNQSTQGLCVIDAGIPMRAKATATLSGTLSVTDFGNTTTTQSSAAIVQDGSTSDGPNKFYLLRLTNFSGLNGRSWVSYNNSNYIILNAEL